jgi:uncharacterized protein YwgA
MLQKSSPNRSFKEQIISKLLLLHILGKYKFDGKTKLHKAIFFAERSTNEKKLKVFNYNFFRYNFGEYSQELQDDFRVLVDKDFLINSKPIEVSSEGKELLKRCSLIIENNKPLLNMVEPIIQHTASMPLDRVKEIAYSRVIVSGRQVKDIEIGTPLLNELSDDEAKEKIFVNDKWIEKLNNIFNLGFVSIDEVTINEYQEIQNFMLPKRIKLLSKLDTYEKAG